VHCCVLKKRTAQQLKVKLEWAAVTATAWLDHVGIAQIAKSAGSPPFSQSQHICQGIKMSIFSTNTTPNTVKWEEKMSAQTRGGKEGGAEPFLLLWQSPSTVIETHFPVQSEGSRGQKPSAFSLSPGDA